MSAAVGAISATKGATFNSQMAEEELVNSDKKNMAASVEKLSQLVPKGDDGHSDEVDLDEEDDEVAALEAEKDQPSLSSSPSLFRIFNLKKTSRGSESEKDQKFESSSIFPNYSDFLRVGECGGDGRIATATDTINGAAAATNLTGKTTVEFAFTVIAVCGSPFLEAINAASGDSAVSEIVLVIQAYRTLRDRGPYPADQVVKDLEGSFAFVVYDSKGDNVFAALGSNGGEQLYWGIVANGFVVISEELEVIKEGYAKSFAPFPKACFRNNPKYWRSRKAKDTCKATWVDREGAGRSGKEKAKEIRKRESKRERKEKAKEESKRESKRRKQKRKQKQGINTPPE
ncbi:hypothetical protein ACFX15_033980 [Malus domestica]